jgi:hypothetical protein
MKNVVEKGKHAFSLRTNTTATTGLKEHLHESKDRSLGRKIKAFTGGSTKTESVFKITK